jgi:hypothetical protein
MKENFHGIYSIVSMELDVNEQGIAQAKRERERETGKGMEEL